MELVVRDDFWESYFANELLLHGIIDNINSKKATTYINFSRSFAKVYYSCNCNNHDFYSSLIEAFKAFETFKSLGAQLKELSKLVSESYSIFVVSMEDFNKTKKCCNQNKSIAIRIKVLQSKQKCCNQSTYYKNQFKLNKTKPCVKHRKVIQFYKKH